MGKKGKPTAVLGLKICDQSNVEKGVRFYFSKRLDFVSIQNIVVCRYVGQLIHSGFYFHELIQTGSLLLAKGRGMECVGGFCCG